MTFTTIIVDLFIDNSHDIRNCDRVYRMSIAELKDMYGTVTVIPSGKKTCSLLFPSAAITWQSKWRSGWSMMSGPFKSLY